MPKLTLTIDIQVDIDDKGVETFQYYVDDSRGSKNPGYKVPIVNTSDPNPFTAVEWTCTVTKGGNTTYPAFAIQFAAGSPCNKGRGRASAGNSIDLKFRKKVTGRMSYFVAVATENDGILTDDPDIIVYE